MRTAFPQPSPPLSSVESSSPSATTTSATASDPPSRTSPPSPSSSSAPFSFPPFEVGDLVTPRYKITGLLGIGATCVTYAAEHTAPDWPCLGRALALKAFPLTALTPWKTVDEFQRQAATLRTLAHPAIPAHIDFFELDDARGDRVFILVQQRATGHSLQHLMKYRPCFSTHNVHAVFRQLLEVLVYLGDLNPPLLHRDIQPASVILGRAPNLGDPRLSLDFLHVANTGIATAREEEGEGGDQGVPRPSTVVGSYGFTPPEQFDSFFDARSDLYAAAATVLYMLTSRLLPALPQSRLKIDMESVIPASERVKLGNVYTVMCKLLEPAPEDRYECAAEALDVLLSNENTQQAGEGAEGSDGGGGSGGGSGSSGGSGGGEKGGLSRTGTTAPSGAEANIANHAVRKLQIFAWESERGDGKEGVGKQFELLADRAGGGRVWRRPPPKLVTLQCDRSEKLLKVKLSARPYLGRGCVSLTMSVILLGVSVFVLVERVAIGESGVALVFVFVCGGGALGLAYLAAHLMTRRTTLVVSFGRGEREAYYYGLSKQSAVTRTEVVEGDARDLKAANVERRMCVTEDEPLYVDELVLLKENEEHVFGRDLQLVEKKWLRDEINDFLNAHRHWR